MLLIDQLKQDSMKMLKSGDKDTSNLYRLVLGQAQQLEDQSDDKVYGIIRKMIKSNKETLKLMEEDGNFSESWNEKAGILAKENITLKLLLPQALSSEEIESFVVENNLDIKGAKSDGQAVGMIMKSTKEKGLSVEAATVKLVVSNLRGNDGK